LANDEFDVIILDNELCNEENVDEYDEVSSNDNKEESNEALVGIGVEGNDSLALHTFAQWWVTNTMSSCFFLLLIYHWRWIWWCGNPTLQTVIQKRLTSIIR
jgi:hypothetical protein